MCHLLIVRLNNPLVCQLVNLPINPVVCHLSRHLKRQLLFHLDSHLINQQSNHLVNLLVNHHCNLVKSPPRVHQVSHQTSRAFNQPFSQAAVLLKYQLANLAIIRQFSQAVVHLVCRLLSQLICHLSSRVLSRVLNHRCCQPDTHQHSHQSNHFQHLLEFQPFSQ